jgi:hypothetical protein
MTVLPSALRRKPRGPVNVTKWRNLCMVEPRSVGEAEEIVARPGGFVGAGRILAPGAIQRLAAGVRRVRTARRQHRGAER